MHGFTSLRFLFRLVAIVEAIYALIGLLTPPDSVLTVTGWVLSPDGQWVAKLLSVALASQAWVAWTLRDQPHLGVAKALAFYQVGSATADWVMWLTLAHQDVFSTAAARFGVLASIPTLYTIGLLLVLAIRAASQTRTAHVPVVARG